MFAKVAAFASASPLALSVKRGGIPAHGSRFGRVCRLERRATAPPMASASSMSPASGTLASWEALKESVPQPDWTRGSYISVPTKIWEGDRLFDNFEKNDIRLVLYRDAAYVILPICELPKFLFVSCRFSPLFFAYLFLLYFLAAVCGLFLHRRYWVRLESPVIQCCDAFFNYFGLHACCVYFS